MLLFCYVFHCWLRKKKYQLNWWLTEGIFDSNVLHFKLTLSSEWRKVSTQHGCFIYRSFFFQKYFILFMNSVVELYFNFVYNHFTLCTCIVYAVSFFVYIEKNMSLSNWYFCVDIYDCVWAVVCVCMCSLLSADYFQIVYDFNLIEHLQT